MAAPKLWPLRDDRSLSAYAKLAYVMLWTRLPDIRPSMSTLAADMSVSKTTAKNAVRELADAGLVKVIPRVTGKRENDSNVYELIGVGRSATHNGTQGALPPGRQVPPKNGSSSTESKGDKSLASRLARPAVTRADVFNFVREAVAASYSRQEAEDLCDGQCIALWYLLISNRKPADPVKYLCKIFDETPYLDTHLASAGTEEDWT